MLRENGKKLKKKIKSYISEPQVSFSVVNVHDSTFRKEKNWTSMACLSTLSHGEWCIEAMGSEHITVMELAMDSPVYQNIKVSNM